MERETLGTALHTGYTAPGGTDWDWLRQGMALCPDAASKNPGDLGNWCHQPFLPAYVAPQTSARVANAYGPALLCPNVPGTAASTGIQWNDTTDAGGNALTNHPWFAWTIAIGVARHDYSATFCKLWAIWSGGTRHWWLRVSHGGQISWEQTSPSRSVASDAGIVDASAYGPSCTIVVVTRHGPDTIIYHNGVEVASAAWGTMLFSWSTQYLGMDYNTKKNAAYSGTYGPMILSRIAWTPEQVAQWAADPWGWRKPAWVPQRPLYSPLVCDVQTRSSVAADGQTRAAVASDVQTRVAVMTDALTRAAVVCDAGLRAAVVADAQARAALACGTQTRAAVIADARTRAAVIADAQTRAAAIADARARAAVAADAQARAAVSGDVQTQED